MRHDDSVPAALRDDGLGGVVRGVDVHVRHGAEELIGPAQAVVTEGRARKPFHRAVHAHVQDGVRAVALLQPFVIRGVLRVRGEIALEKQTHGIALHPERGLDADEDVADREARDVRPAVLALRGRESVVRVQRAPRLLHAPDQHVRRRQERDGAELRGAPALGKLSHSFRRFGETFSPATATPRSGSSGSRAERASTSATVSEDALVAAFLASAFSARTVSSAARAARRRPPRAAVVQRAERLDQRLAVRHGRIALQPQVVALVAQSLQQALERLRDVEQRRRAGGADARGKP